MPSSCIAPIPRDRDLPRCPGTHSYCRQSKVTAWTVLLCSPRTAGTGQRSPGTRQRDLGVSTWRTEEIQVNSRKGCYDEIQSDAPTELLLSKTQGGSPRQAQLSTPIPTAITKHYASLLGGYLLTSCLGEKP